MQGKATNPMSKALVPDLSSIPAYVEGDDMEDHLEKFVFYGQLRPGMQVLIKALAEDLVSHTVRTNQQLADALGIGERTVRRYKTDEDFAVAMGFIMAHLTASNANEIIAEIWKCLKNGSWNAGKFLLELCGVYVAKHQTQNVNLNYNQQLPEQSMTFDEALDETLIALGNQGLSANQIVERYEQLRASGAF